jgi:hypothetical protein
MARKLQTYRMDAGGETLGHHKATTPARALKEFFGDQLMPFPTGMTGGRYGKLVDGRNCAALLVHGGRRYLGGHEGGRRKGSA